MIPQPSPPGGGWDVTLQWFVAEICIERLPHPSINWLAGRRRFPRFCLMTIHAEVKHLPAASGGTCYPAALRASCLYSQLGGSCQHILPRKTAANVAVTLFVLTEEGCVGRMQTGRARQRGGLLLSASHSGGGGGGGALAATPRPPPPG